MRDSMLSTHHGRNGLLQLALFSCVLAGALYALREPVLHIYHAWTLTPAGMIINGFIVALFLVGMLRIAWLLAFYQREESAIRRFAHDWMSNNEIAGESLIHDRYIAMRGLYEQRTPVHQGALAAALLAREKARTSSLRYVNNVLILCGVFGTIVSLSIALVGASGMLEGAVDAEGMGMVIHGMSTALSTTMTAIACYLFFHYFLLQAENARTAVLASIEHISTTLLAPRFHVQAESLPQRLAELIDALREHVRRMDQTQQRWLQAQEQLARQMEEKIARLSQRLEAGLAHLPVAEDEASQARLSDVWRQMHRQQMQAHAEQMDALRLIAARLEQGFRLPET